MPTTSTHWRGRCLAAAVGVGLLTAAAGCGDSSSTTSAAAPAAGSTSTASGGGGDAGVSYAKAELAKYSGLVSSFKAPGPDLKAADIKAKLDGKTVWYIPTFLQAPIFTANSKGLVEPLGLAGAKVHVCDAGANPTQASACLKQAVAAKAAGIITDAMDYSFASQAQGAAVKAGIPVIATDNDNTKDFPKDPLLVPVGIGVPKTARLAVDFIISDSNGKANALYAADNSNDGKIETAATLDEFKRYCPGCKVTVVEFGDLTVQRLATSVSAAMVKNPKIDYVDGGYDAPSGIFALQGAKQVVGRKFKYVTATGQPPGLQRVAAGQQDAVPGTDTVNAMWSTADALFRAITGAPPVTYTNALRVFTKANVPATVKDPNAYAAGSWYTDGGFKPIYQKTWGL